MTYAHKKYLQWIWTNGLGVALLLSGIEGLVTLAIILIWITAVLGSIFLSVPLCDRVFTEAVKKGDGKLLYVNRYINISFDLLLAIYLAYLNYPILAAVYIIHIFGVINLYNAQEKSFIKKLKGEYDEQ